MIPAVGMYGEARLSPLDSHSFLRSSLLLGAAQSHTKKFPPEVGITHSLIAKPLSRENRGWFAIVLGSEVASSPSLIYFTRSHPSHHTDRFDGSLRSFSVGKAQSESFVKSIETSIDLSLPSLEPFTWIVPKSPHRNHLAPLVLPSSMVTTIVPVAWPGRAPRLVSSASTW